jgi:hypothetical protein
MLSEMVNDRVLLLKYWKQNCTEARSSCTRLAECVKLIDLEFRSHDQNSRFGRSIPSRALDEEALVRFDCEGAESFCSSRQGKRFRLASKLYLTRYLSHVFLHIRQQKSRTGQLPKSHFRVWKEQN